MVFGDGTRQLRTLQSRLDGLRRYHGQLQERHRHALADARDLEEEIQRVERTGQEVKAEIARLAAPPVVAQAGPPPYERYRPPPLPGTVYGQVPHSPRKPPSVCPECFRTYVVTGTQPGGICNACVRRRSTWSAPPRAPPQFWNPANIGRRY